MENLTPPANGQKRPGWSTASAARATLERCQLEPLRLDQCQCQQRTGTGTGEQTTTAHHLHRDAPGAAPPRQRRPKARAAAHTAPPALAFFFCPSSSPAACRISTPARAGCCRQPPRGKAGKYPGSAGRSTWILRPPPAPAWISTASAAPDDHASSRPPPTMTTHQRQPCHTCTAPTACQPCQTSQQPAAHRQHLPTPHPASPAAHLPQQISTTHDHQTAQNQPTAARCRRGQILYLPGISTMQYSRKLGQNSPYLSPYPLSSPLRRPAVALGQPWAPPAPARHRRPGLPPPCCCCPCPAPPRERYCPPAGGRGAGSEAPKYF